MEDILKMFIRESRVMKYLKANKQMYLRVGEIKIYSQMNFSQMKGFRIRSEAGDN